RTIRSTSSVATSVPAGIPRIGAPGAPRCTGRMLQGDQRVSNEKIVVRVEGGLAWITLQRPEVKNAIDDEAREALLAALERVASDTAIRAAVLTGAGDAFCTGADLWGGKRDPA